MQLVNHIVQLSNLHLEYLKPSRGQPESCLSNPFLIQLLVSE